MKVFPCSTNVTQSSFPTLGGYMTQGGASCAATEHSSGQDFYKTSEVAKSSDRRVM